ncbi:MAG: elongation factor P [Acidobacteriota bacterium]|jgi:Translation elongation factor P (EF-P)/translation initiation factor 5A (eIF-5A)|nr:elongation factor P [Acidobacteriota bacterium]OQB59238.1 MAG: Elongation factor P-like protein [Candidatus Aminicenantes bacterium ADurb.Bin147]HNQ79631.1 elongation factor P [Candidatus Aminicenantes bacterium]MDD8028234.1 elongation factor P [Acidobacteriota bacterium]MDD8032748.1 elongation factor P [Acidobacteriota bacterium]
MVKSFGMFKASDLKKNNVVKIEGDPCLVETVNVQKPSARGAATLYKFRFRNARTKRKTDVTVRGDDLFDEAELERRPVQVLYGDALSFSFMDLEDFSQFTLAKEEIEEEWPYLTEGLEGVLALSSEGRILGLELPTLVTLPIVETRPSVKGGSVTARTKPAVLSTGMAVQVPEYLETGDLIRVDTRTGLYASKA